MCGADLCSDGKVLLSRGNVQLGLDPWWLSQVWRRGKVSSAPSLLPNEKKLVGLVGDHRLPWSRWNHFDLLD
jgi:hypothetical protein